MFIHAKAPIVLCQCTVTVDARDLLLVVVAEIDGGLAASAYHWTTALHQVSIFEVVLFLLLFFSGAHNLHAACRLSPTIGRRC